LSRHGTSLLIWSLNRVRQKAGLDKDFPDLLTKPVDAPYGPYADGFDQQQHMYGPFGPIRAEHAKGKEAMRPR
jgi:thiosulfate dehydrogenase